MFDPHDPRRGGHRHRKGALWDRLMALKASGAPLAFNGPEARGHQDQR